jgi:catalase-peroxidase
VPFAGGRGDASQADTDVTSFGHLELRTDGFRNYAEKEFAVSPEEMMLDKAQLLACHPVEMTVLVGGCLLGQPHRRRSLECYCNP